MKILIAAVTFLFMAAAAFAGHKAPVNPITSLSQTQNNDLGQNTYAPELKVVNKTEVKTFADNQPGLLKSLVKKIKGKPGAEEIDNLMQDQTTPQNPANQEAGADEAKSQQEVKAIPKARRVEKPAKIDNSAKRPTTGSAKRGNTMSAKPDRAVNPNQAGNPARAGRPAGAGRPTGAGRPNKGKGNN